MSIIMTAPKKIYDLEQRTYVFAQECRDYVQQLPQTIANNEYGKQLIRSSGSVAANYLEASESLGKKDFFMRMKISRKEAKESALWIRLTIPIPQQCDTQQKLYQESRELTHIFGAIVKKS